MACSEYPKLDRSLCSVNFGLFSGLFYYWKIISQHYSVWSASTVCQQRRLFTDKRLVKWQEGPTLGKNKNELATTAVFVSLFTGLNIRDNHSKTWQTANSFILLSDLSLFSSLLFSSFFSLFSPYFQQNNKKLSCVSLLIRPLQWYWIGFQKITSTAALRYFCFVLNLLKQGDTQM